MSYFVTYTDPVFKGFNPQQDYISLFVAGSMAHEPINGTMQVHNILLYPHSNN